MTETSGEGTRIPRDPDDDYTREAASLRRSFAEERVAAHDRRRRRSA